MSLEFSIRVVDEDGDPVSGRRITVFGEGILGIGSHTTEYTDSDGWAEFDVGDRDEWYIHEIYIGSELIYEEREYVYDGDSYSFVDPD